MARAFIQNGVWRSRPADAIDPGAQRQATLRVSLIAAVVTLAFAVGQDGGAPTIPKEPGRSLVISAPDIIVAKADDRVPALPSPFRRRAPLVETPEVATSPSGPDTTATARTTPAVRGVEVVDAGMIRAGDMTYRLAGIVLPETDRICRRIDGLAVSCVDRAQSYLQLLVKSRPVVCDRAPQRHDGPLEATCRVGEADIAEQMVRQGWARPSDQPEERFLLAEAAAKKQKLGIWRE